MTTELTFLAFAVILGFVHIVLAARSATMQRGVQWNFSARDAQMPPLTGVAGRLDRALHNFSETFPLFAVAVLIAHVAGRNGELAQWGAGLYLGARIVYLPLYAAGVYAVRTVVWSIATLGIVLTLAALWW